MVMPRVTAVLGAAFEGWPFRAADAGRRLLLFLVVKDEPQLREKVADKDEDVGPTRHDDEYISRAEDITVFSS